MMRWRLWPRTVSAEAYDAVCGTVEEVMAERDMARAQRDEALQRAEQQAEEFALYRQAMNRPPKANGALLDARREIEHLRVDLLEARRTAKSAEEANRQLMDTIRAHQSLGSIVAQFKPMLRRIAQAHPKPVKAASRRAKQKGGAS